MSNLALEIDDKESKAGVHLHWGHGGGSDSNAVHRLHALLKASFGQCYDHQIDEQTAAGACLRPLLAALHWTGQARHLAEALPHFDLVHDIEGLRIVLARVNYKSTTERMSLDRIHKDMLPCLFEAADRPLMVVVSMESDGRLLVFDSFEKDFRTIDPDGDMGVAYLFKAIDGAQEKIAEASSGWVQTLFAKFHRTFFVLFGLSLMIKVLALAVPIYIMSVYELAIGTKSPLTLASLCAGIGLIVMVELQLRNLRGRALAYLGTRIENVIAIRVFQRLLYMPIALTETASSSSHLTRFRQFEGIRELFSGTLANALLDLPFLIVFVVAVFVIGGPLGYVPVVLIGLYLAMAVVTIPLAKSLLRDNGAIRARRRNFLMELTSKHRGIRDNNAGRVWLRRFEGLTSQYLLSQFKLHQFNMIVQTLAQAFAVAAGAATIGIGTMMAIGGDLSMGALIATTALVWRGLSPLQVTFLGLNQVGQAIESFKQINRLFRLPQERNPGSLPTHSRSFLGNISLQNGSIRYSSEGQGALRNVTLKAKAGELIAVTGPSGAGKSTLLKVLAGLHRLQAGALLFDELDIRQFDVAEIRQNVGYVPQQSGLFYGTIAQNIKLAHPMATSEDVERALAAVGALEEVHQLPDGIHTRLQGHSEYRLSSGLLQQISLARAFVKNVGIYLLDEPGTALDRNGDLALMRLLEARKGQATTILVTHRPSHMWMADRVIVLQDGAVIADGSPEKIVPNFMNSSEQSASARPVVGPGV